MSREIEISELNLSAKTYCQLAKRGIRTVGDALSQLASVTLEHRRAGKELLEELMECGYIWHTPGEYVQENVLLDPYDFEDLESEVRHLVAVDVSTQSHEWYRVVLVLEYKDSGEDGGSIVYWDGISQQVSRISRCHYKAGDMWRFLWCMRTPEQPPLHTVAESPLTLDAPILAGLRADFDSILQDALLRMQQGAWGKASPLPEVSETNGVANAISDASPILKKSVQASMAVKLDITLTTQDDGETAHIVPTFAHKITATIQSKSERSGKSGGGHELYYDDAIEGFAVREMPDVEGQLSLMEDAE